MYCNKTIPLILDNAGQSFSNSNGIFSIFICCCRNFRSLCSPSSPVKCRESLWSDKSELPSDSEEDKDGVGITCFFLLLRVINKTGWSLLFDDFASLFVALPWPLVAKELCSLLLLGLLVRPASALLSVCGLFLCIWPFPDESTACISRILEVKILS